MAATVEPSVTDRQTDRQAAPALRDGELYHAFVAHSNLEADFAHLLASELESHGYSCCYYERDFVPGKSIIANICENIEKSRRVILIISQNFLQSKWFTFEVSEAVMKSVADQKKSIIPVIYGGLDPKTVPHYVKNVTYLEYPGDVHFYKKLMKGIDEEASLSATVPAGNVAHGLAWSYFYGYLNLVLPGLKQRVMSSEFWKRRGSVMLPKLTVILPEDCYCPPVLTKPDPKLTFAGHIPYNATRAGNINRDYKSSVYEIKDERDGLVYYFVSELATPLLSLYEMEEGKLAGLSKEQKFHQMKLFYEKLSEILDHSPWRDCYTLIFYKWSLNEGVEKAYDHVPLSCVVLATLKEELKKMREMETSQQLGGLSITEK